MSGTSRVIRRVLIAWAALVVAAAVGLGAVWQHNRGADDLVAARAAAMTTAEHTVTELLTYDAGTLASRLRRQQSLLAPSFRDQYRTMVEKQVLPTARKHGVRAQAKVADAALVRGTADEAEVLLYLDVRTTTKASPTGSTQGGRLLVTLTRSAGQWLVSGLQSL